MNLRETCPLVRWREGCKCSWVCLALELWQGHISHPSLTRALLVSLQDPDLVPFPRWILQVPGVVGQVLCPWPWSLLPAALPLPGSALGAAPQPAMAWPSLNLSLAVTIKQTQLRGFGPNKSHRTPLSCLLWGWLGWEMWRGARAAVGIM